MPIVTLDLDRYVGPFIARGRNGYFTARRLDVGLGLDGAVPRIVVAVRSGTPSATAPIVLDGPPAAMAQLCADLLVEICRLTAYDLDPRLVPRWQPPREAPIDKAPRTRVISTTPEGD